MNSEEARPKVLAYYFPDWHRDNRNEQWFGSGWTEWKLVEQAMPRFEGHRQPRIPLLGYRDEANPTNAESDIELARLHGVDGFLVDYYWYDDGPYLDSALRNGILQAANVDRIEFALMWANHNLTDIFPAAEPGGQPRLLKSGAIDRQSFDAMVDEIVDTYFVHPSYLKVDGRPWLSVNEIGRFIEGLGGVEQAAAAVRHLDDRARERGFPGVHMDAVVWGFAVLPEAVVVREPANLLKALGFRSATSYVWVHHSDPSTMDFPIGDWAKVRDDAFHEYASYARDLPVPFYPNVSVGWDSSPRTVDSVPFERVGYPWTPVFDAGPEEFEEGLRRASDFLRDTKPAHPIITINAWNEWTEGSYLLPDTTHGNAYLEAIRRTFVE